MPHTDRKPLGTSIRPTARPRGPSWEALIEVLENLRCVPDAAGETRLSADEAAKIRRCGFNARAGVIWRCPPLPDELVRWHPVLYHLSGAIDPRSRTCIWHPKRAALLPTPAPRDDLGRAERRLLRSFQRSGCLRRYELQRKHWRISARIFRHTLDLLIAADRVTLADGYLYPMGRAEFAAMRARQSEPRGPKLLYTIF